MEEVKQQTEQVPEEKIEIAEDLEALVEDLKQVSRAFKVVSILSPLGNEDVKETLLYLSRLHKVLLDECIAHNDCDKVPALAEAKKKAQNVSSSSEE